MIKSNKSSHVLIFYHDIIGVGRVGTITKLLDHPDPDVDVVM